MWSSFDFIEPALKLGFKGLKSVGLRAVDSIHCGAALVLFPLIVRAIVGRPYQPQEQKGEVFSRESCRFHTLWSSFGFISTNCPCNSGASSPATGAKRLSLGHGNTHSVCVTIILGTVSL